MSKQVFYPDSFVGKRFRLRALTRPGDKRSTHRFVPMHWTDRGAGKGVVYFGHLTTCCTTKQFTLSLDELLRNWTEA